MLAVTGPDIDMLISGQSGTEQVIFSTRSGQAQKEVPLTIKSTVCPGIRFCNVKLFPDCDGWINPSAETIYALAQSMSFQSIVTEVAEDEHFKANGGNSGSTNTGFDTKTDLHPLSIEKAEIL